MNRKVTKAVFPVAGLGTRFLPATKAIPKEVLPLVDRPLIQYAIDEARAAGIEELRAAGLDSLPGGGAEVFSDRVRDELYPKKMGHDRWKELARALHGHGFRTNATMLYGMTETLEERVGHLDQLRALQDDNTFDPSIETRPEYLDAAKELAAGDINHVVFGHTHIARKVDLGGGRSYLNSGTWADLIVFPKEIVSGTEDEALPKLREFVGDLRHESHRSACLSVSAGFRTLRDDDLRAYLDRAFCIT